MLCIHFSRCSLINCLRRLVIYSSSISSSMVSSCTTLAFSDPSIGDVYTFFTGEPLFGDPLFAASTVARNPDSISCLCLSFRPLNNLNTTFNPYPLVNQLNDLEMPLILLHVLLKLHHVLRPFRQRHLFHQRLDIYWQIV